MTYYAERGKAKTRKGRKGLANALTMCRIALSIALLIPAAFSPAFFAIYALAGVTDMLDGHVARRMGTESDLGAKLDSVADLILVVVSLVKVLPAIAVPTWLWVWVAAIALVKAANAVSGLVVERHLVMLHTTANKVTGLVVFLVPFAIPFVGINIPAVIACAIATFAAIQEGHCIRTGTSIMPWMFSPATLDVSAAGLSPDPPRAACTSGFARKSSGRERKRSRRIDTSGNTDRRRPHMNFEDLKSPELLEKLKSAKTADELVALAKEEGVDLSDEQLEAFSGGDEW